MADLALLFQVPRLHNECAVGAILSEVQYIGSDRRETAH